jgi:hypothetical protein
MYAKQVEKAGNEKQPDERYGYSLFRQMQFC